MAKQEKFGVLIEGKETVSPAAKKAEGGLKGLTKSMLGAVTIGNLLADALKKVAGKIKEFVKEGVKMALTLKGVEAGFKKLAKQPDFFLQRLTKATKGTVSQLDLMKQANQALLLGIDQEALPAMFEGAATIAQATGDDITYALNSITAGIGRQSRMLLDNLGIVIKAEEAYRTYAAELGTTAGMLTQVQRTTAFTNAAIKALNLRVDKLGGELIPTAQTSINQMKSSLDGLKTALGDRAAPALKTFSDLFTPFLKNLGELVDKQEEVDYSKLVIKPKTIQEFRDSGLALLHTELGLAAMRKEMEEGTLTIDNYDISVMKMGFMMDFFDKEILKVTRDVDGLTASQKSNLVVTGQMTPTVHNLNLKIEESSEVTKEDTKEIDKNTEAKKENLKITKELSDIERSRAMGVQLGSRGVYGEPGYRAPVAQELTDGTWGIPTPENPLKPDVSSEEV